MSRSVSITVPPDRTDLLLSEIGNGAGLIGLSVQRGVSVVPPGDVVTLQVAEPRFHEILRILDRYDVGRSPGTSVVTQIPTSLVDAGFRHSVTNERSEAGWEEMEVMIARESNLTPTMAAVISIAGVFAAAGLATGSLHWVVAGMLVAPGFEPLLRLSLGVAARSAVWKVGLVQTFAMYGILALAAGLASLALPAPGAGSAYLPSSALVSYWTSFTGSSVAVSALAAVAGALLVATHRSVLTAGVMVALSLVPGAALAGMGLARGNWALSGQGALRWALDAALVAVGGAAVLTWKKSRIHRRSLGR